MIKTRFIVIIDDGCSSPKFISKLHIPDRDRRDQTIDFANAISVSTSNAKIFYCVNDRIFNMTEVALTLAIQEKYNGDAEWEMVEVKMTP